MKKIFLVLFICGIFFVKISQAKIVDRIVAVVNDDVITLSELDQAAAPLFKQYLQGVKDPIQREQIKQEIRKKVLKQLIDEKLIEQEIEKRGIKASDEEIKTFIEHFKQQNGLDDKELRKLLASQGLTFDEYRKQVAKQIKRIKLVQSRIQQIVVTPEEIERYYRKHYLSEQKTKYELAAIITNGKDAEKRIQKAYQELLAGKHFAQVAEKYSDIPESGKGLGSFSLDELAPQVRKTLAGLKPGAFSKPIKVGNSWQIFRIINVKKEGTKALTEVKKEIENKLRQEKIDQALNNWLKELREQAYIRILL
ncbi:SurA N-terminal domain-containing protein [Thermodesulfatator atlanticus]|uniref:SurA N-terminal domain-containing protein n=1 Tax=Thermodesulfatator atlanticus TaxID=501497 RepID=UPI0003B53EED|nr:SurA N-terminal domain-containing protein [Thermodesulfatator atlanticus]